MIITANTPKVGDLISTFCSKLKRRLPDGVESLYFVDEDWGSRHFSVTYSGDKKAQAVLDAFEAFSVYPVTPVNYKSYHLKMVESSSTNKVYARGQTIVIGTSPSSDAETEHHKMKWCVYISTYSNEVVLFSELDEQGNPHHNPIGFEQYFSGPDRYGVHSLMWYLGWPKVEFIAVNATQEELKKKKTYYNMLINGAFRI